MAWLILAGIVILIALIAVFGYGRVKIPRDPTREGALTYEVVRAYNSVNRWPVFSLSRHLILRELRKCNPEGVLVDIGCGPGHLLASISNKFPQVKTIGLDNNRDMLRLARQNLLSESGQHAGLILGDVNKLSFGDNTVDFIISSLALHHWADSLKPLSEIQRVLKPGGRFLIMDLRRDSRRWFYYALRLGQALFVPSAIRHSNGAIGSFHAAYTLAEAENMMKAEQFRSWQVKPQTGWLYIHGRK